MIKKKKEKRKGQTEKIVINKSFTNKKIFKKNHQSFPLA